MTSIDFEQEQREIIDKIGSLLKLSEGKGPAWGRFKGDVVCRVVAKYIQPHLPNGSKIVGPSVYIAGFKFPWEFDLAIVNIEAEPEPFTNAYKGEQIRNILEIKMHGVYGKKEKIEEIVSKRITEPFREVAAGYPQIRPAYLAIQETINPIKPDATRYADLTRKALGNYPAFILKDTRGKVFQPREWQRFIEYIVGKNTDD